MMKIGKIFKWADRGKHCTSKETRSANSMSVLAFRTTHTILCMLHPRTSIKTQCIFCCLSLLQSLHPKITRQRTADARLLHPRYLPGIIIMSVNDYAFLYLLFLQTRAQRALQSKEPKHIQSKHTGQLHPRCLPGVIIMYNDCVLFHVLLLQLGERSIIITK